MKRALCLTYCALLAFACTALPMPVSASVIVTGLSAFDAVSNRFIYNYSVTNSGSAEEIIQVTFPVSSSAALMGITAPTGFKLTYDTVGARVNFLWDDDDFTMQTFAPNSTVSGFSFTSPDSPGASIFVASDINQDFTGVTSAPVAVPEPSPGLLGLLSLLAPLAIFRRRP